MKAIRVVIVDDETQARNSLLSDLKIFKESINVIGEANSMESAITLIENEKPDLVFLDINLGDGSGFNVLERCAFKKFKTVFVTAYDQYAIKAFKVSALDFLLKPVDVDELKLAIDKATDTIINSNLLAQMSAFKENLNPDIKDKKIVLKEMDAIHVVKLSELIMCEASGIYTTFYLTTNKQIVVSKNLKEYEDIFESFGFLRVHNSFLVNASKIERFERADGGFVVMEGGAKVPVAQRRRDVVVNYLKCI